jgi:hypothetical protein
MQHQAVAGVGVVTVGGDGASNGNVLHAHGKAGDVRALHTRAGEGGGGVDDLGGCERACA